MQECKTAATVECGNNAFWYSWTITSQNYCVVARCLWVGAISGHISANQQLSLSSGTNCPGDVVGGQPCQQTLESDDRRFLRWLDRTSCTVVTPVPARTERAQRWGSLKSV